MAKIKELLAGREKLAKYDELTEWKRMVEDNKVFVSSNKGDNQYVTFSPILAPIPDHIKQIIVSAIDAEIKKLDEE